MKTIPPSRLRSCCYCQDQFDSESPGNYHFGTGWVKVRYTGGPHLTLPRYADRWACGTCIDRLVAGIHPNQLSIFDEPIE